MGHESKKEKDELRKIKSIAEKMGFKMVQSFDDFYYNGSRWELIKCNSGNDIFSRMSRIFSISSENIISYDSATHMVVIRLRDLRSEDIKKLSEALNKESYNVKTE